MEEEVPNTDGGVRQIGRAAVLALVYNEKSLGSGRGKRPQSTWDTAVLRQRVDKKVSTCKRSLGCGQEFLAFLSHFTD